jgi:hypothetical protein
MITQTRTLNQQWVKHKAIVYVRESWDGKEYGYWKETPYFDIPFVKFPAIQIPLDNKS